MKQYIKYITGIKRQLFFIIAIVVGSIAIMVVSSALYNQPELDWSASIDHTLRPETARFLDGVSVRRDQARLRPIAVMIENHTDSRPVAGLEHARVIYEVIVEGDITRFLAFFDPTFSVKQIGPVRSSRPFFIELAQEWDALYFHAGGSDDALVMLRAGALDNVNEISGDGIYFFRDVKRNAPHNLFTSSDQMLRAVTAKGYATTTDFMPWKFKHGEPVADVATKRVATVEVTFSKNLEYAVEYQYNPVDNNYTRFQAGAPHRTASGIILKADTIVKQFVEADIIDDYGRLEIDVTSGGLAIVYRDGTAIEGTWRKEDGRTRFFDNQGQEIRLNQGVTWVELLFN